MKAISDIKIQMTYQRDLKKWIIPVSRELSDAIDQLSKLGEDKKFHLTGTFEIVFGERADKKGNETHIIFGVEL